MLGNLCNIILRIILINSFTFIIVINCTATTTDTKIQNKVIKIIIAKDGSRNFNNIQNAINSIPCYDNSHEFRIYIKNGLYNEKVQVYSSRAKIVLIGENVDSTIISYNDYSGKIVNDDTLTTHNSYTFRVMTDEFEAQNITFQNTAGRIGQAVVMEVKSGDRVVFNNCKFLGNQDTFYANSDGRVYVENCYIEGTTDFIFGKSIVLFDSCVIHSKYNTYITAASTPEGCNYGFVFTNCRLTADSDVNNVFLGRPWRSFARTVFINCYMGNHIVPEGWNNWSNAEKEKTVYYAEYNSSGPGSNYISQRAKWSHQLNKYELQNYTIEKIFSKKASHINFETDWKPKLK